MKFSTILMLAGLGVTTSGAALAADTQESDDFEAAIARQNMRFSAAFSAGDATLAGQFYTEDAVFVTPESAAQRGRAEIVKNMADEFKKSALTLTLETLSLDRLSDTRSAEVCRWKMAVVMHGTPVEAGSGDCMVIWEKADNGEWLMEYDMVAYDMPASAPQAG